MAEKKGKMSSCPQPPLLFILSVSKGGTGHSSALYPPIRPILTVQVPSDTMDFAKSPSDACSPHRPFGLRPSTSLRTGLRTKPQGGQPLGTGTGADFSD